MKRLTVSAATCALLGGAGTSIITQAPAIGLTCVGVSTVLGVLTVVAHHRRWA